MLGSATFTMLVSRISRTTASITPSMSSQERRLIDAGRGEAAASVPVRAPQRTRTRTVDRETDREPRASRPSARTPASTVSAVERDAHRHALHDLGEVPGRVVGREQRVLRPGRRGERLDAAAKHQIGVRRRPGPRRRRPRLISADLRLLEVRRDPAPARVSASASERLSWRDVRAELDAAAPDHAVEGRLDDGVLERELRLASAASA